MPVVVTPSGNGEHVVVDGFHRTPGVFFSTVTRSLLQRRELDAHLVAGAFGGAK
jgi:hypothetical protein